MKNTLPFLLLVICALGCNKFGRDASSTTNTTNKTANAAPAKLVKVVDLPAMVGKSRDEIKKMVSATPTHEDPWLEYSLPEGDLTIQFTKDKPSNLSFSFKSISFGESTISGLDRADQLGDMAGIDVHGKTPTSTNGLADHYDVDVHGKKVDVSFLKIQEKFRSVSIDLY